MGKTVKSRRGSVAKDLCGVAGNDRPVFDGLRDDAAGAYYAPRADIGHDNGSIANPRILANEDGLSRGRLKPHRGSASFEPVRVFAADDVNVTADQAIVADD